MNESIKFWIINITNVFVLILVKYIIINYNIAYHIFLSHYSESSHNGDDELSEVIEKLEFQILNKNKVILFTNIQIQ